MKKIQTEFFYVYNSEDSRTDNQVARIVAVNGTHRPPDALAPLINVRRGAEGDKQTPNRPPLMRRRRRRRPGSPGRAAVNGTHWPPDALAPLINVRRGAEGAKCLNVKL